MQFCLIFFDNFHLFLTLQDGNILLQDILTTRGFSRHIFQAILKDEKFASCSKERLTLDFCLELVNARLRARRIRSCVMVSNIKSIDLAGQQSKHTCFEFTQTKKEDKIRNTPKATFKQSLHKYN